MNHHHPHIYFLFGAWLSFIGVVIAGSAIVPISPGTKALSPAAIYRSALHEELREATTVLLPGKVIAIDEATMRLTLYEDGTSVRTYPIERIAAPGAFTEVPSGSFSIMSKEPQHRSPTTPSWMSWAVAFGSDYFIHGRAKDASGTVAPLAAISIELSEEDAKDVYEFAELGGKVIATGGVSRSSLDLPRYRLLSGGPLPLVTSPRFIVADIETGDVLWERRASEDARVGALSSLRLALLSTEALDQYEAVRLGDLLLPKARRKMLPGNIDEVSVGSLLYPLLFDANETAGTSLQEKLAREGALVELSTTAIGVDSARGLFALFRQVYERERYLLDISLRETHELYDDRGAVRYRWENKNPWVMRGDAAYRGGLGEFAPGGGGAGMFLFTLPLSEFGTRPIAIVLLDSTDVVADVETIKRFLAGHYRYGARRELAVEPERSRSMERLRRFFREELDYDRNL